MVTAELRWDPFDRALHKNPYDVWRRLRDEAPVYYNEQHDFYALSRFDDVLSASLDTETFSSEHGITLDAITPDPWPSPKAMIMMDPPDHTAMRKMVNRTFFRSKVAELEDRIRMLCRGYLDPFVGSGGFDYVRDFSMKLPVMVISSLLGFPEEDHDNLREWSDLQLYREEGSTELSEVGRQAGEKLFAYYRDQVASRRAERADDIVSQLMDSDLVQPGKPTRRLDDGELLMFIALINVAGNETVARLLGWAAVTLARFPEQRAKLVDNPSLIPGAVEELLRYEAPSPVQGRFAVRDATYHGTVIPAGTKVALLTGSAGRDERQYPNPDVFDVTRTGIRHVSFGHGAHFCLGAALARLEARVALEETLARFPTWDIDEDAVEYVHTNSVRGPASVQIRL
ncbi:cytochrome P450 [Mycolicibacterium thermoresistibile]|uniref:Steroid C26-monooxygenase n=2 Tax=Mycolicibacterium thermoresistibile TaxID=1797 RepID=G7CFS9_MYCT3|nr:cytochrome P450 [Mycolicibacterium thermoresistibile]EHI13358.1 cytochrome P450 [Mycolicibacterium thermoresistibile ATCC 19527]MCV7189151.1 cytochrome P450 [Mycolicibacterium thermoresistibile]GAT14659.1 cytochrome P450 [Mycolicibacterium thermoresistibile]SNW19886.1 cytochrome P450 [Mycolicibacterium thermoresistibile]